MKNNSPKFESFYFTPRLNIIGLHITDASFIQDLTNTDGWKKYIGDRNINDEFAAIQYIERILDNPNTMYWTVFEDESMTRIGIITFMKREYLEHWDIGFAFLPEYMNKGLAMEATATILNNIKANNSNIPILATTLPNNLRSINLLKKLGFHSIGVVEDHLQLFSTINN